jgi:hypothetical protein
MVQIEHKEFSEVATKFSDKPFEVTDAWVDYQIAKGNKAKFFVDSKGQPQILCWARVKKIKFIGEILDIQGPIFKASVTTKQLNKFLDKIKELPYKGVFINLSTQYKEIFEVACRKAMFKRPIGQSNTSLSILVDTNHFNPDTKWKRNIKKAANINFGFELRQNVTIEDCKIIEKLHAENKKIKNLNYLLKADEIYQLVNSKNIYVGYLYKNDKPIAARIISIEEAISYDIYACNSFESRNNGATQFFMQRIFEYLKNSDIHYFDFSRIPVGKQGASGVYDFKNSTRGKVIQYNGEWVYFKNKKLRHFYYLYNLIINKKDFY